MTKPKKSKTDNAGCETTEIRATIPTYLAQAARHYAVDSSSHVGEIVSQALLEFFESHPDLESYLPTKWGAK